MPIEIARPPWAQESRRSSGLGLECIRRASVYALGLRGAMTMKVVGVTVVQLVLL